MLPLFRLYSKVYWRGYIITGENDTKKWNCTQTIKVQYLYQIGSLRVVNAGISSVSSSPSVSFVCRDASNYNTSCNYEGSNPRDKIENICSALNQAQLTSMGRELCSHTWTCLSKRLEFCNAVLVSDNTECHQLEDR